MGRNVLRIAIDEKSLFYGCKNDFEKGHTATVSTPINQSIHEEKWHKDILAWIGSEAETLRESVPDRIIDICQRSSHSGNIIQNVFIFDNIYADGRKLNVDYQYIMYIKKETDEKIKNKYGHLVDNTHLGRLKLHYPITFEYAIDGYNINNEAILKEVLNNNMGYAYIVRGFEFDIEKKSLNIITSIIGPKNALLSTVFRVAKGTGKKLRTNLDILSADDLELRCIKSEDEDVEEDIFDKRNKVSKHNGRKGEDYVFDLLERDNKQLYHTSVEYPTSPYDMEYVDSSGTKIYVEVKSTQSDRLSFRMSRYEYEFMEKYKENYVLYMVTDVKSDFPKCIALTYLDILKLNKQVLNYLFTK